MNRLLYLQNLCNRFGDFSVARIRLKPDSIVQSSKWRSVLDCWQSEEGLRFLSEGTDMTSPPPIVFIDIDNNPTPKHLRSALKICRDYGFSYGAYSTGGRGYHVHVLIRELAMTSIYPRRVRARIRLRFLEKVDGELSKASERHMVLLPGAPHRKTGRPKTLLEAWP